MSVEETFSEIERRLREIQTNTSYRPSMDVKYGEIVTPTDWFGEGEWIWIKLNSKATANGEYFYGWQQILRIVNATGSYTWINGEKFGSVNEFPAIALNNDNLSTTDGRRYPARWNPDTYQWIFFLRDRTTSPYPPGSCFDTPVSVLWYNSPIISRDVPLASTDANCSNSTWIGVAPGASGWPDVLESWRQYLDYNNTTTTLDSKDVICVNGSAVLTTTSGFTPPTSIVLPTINIDNPATIRWELSIHESVPAVHDARNDGVGWFYPNGTSESDTAFISGSSNITVTYGNLSANQSYAYGNSVLGQCQITGPETGNVTITYNKNDPANLNEKYLGKFRLTLMDYVVYNGTSGPDPAGAATNANGLLASAKGLQVVMGQNGTTCDVSKSIRFVPSNWNSTVVSYGNNDYKWSTVATNANWAASASLVLGRRIGLTGKVKWSSCDASATIFESLPADIKWGGPGSVTPWHLNREWNGTFPFEDISFPVSPSRTLSNAPVSGFDYMSEEWWTGNVTIGWRTVYASYAGSYSYVPVSLKWKMEGPI
jgi:hypothetical protein